MKHDDHLMDCTRYLTFARDQMCLKSKDESDCRPVRLGQWS